MVDFRTGCSLYIVGKNYYADSYAHCGIPSMVKEYQQGDCSGAYGILRFTRDSSSGEFPSDCPEIFQIYSRPVVPEITPSELTKAHEEEPAKYISYMEALESKTDIEWCKAIVP